jgi:hypothetical protein
VAVVSTVARRVIGELRRTNPEIFAEGVKADVADVADVAEGGFEGADEGLSHSEMKRLSDSISRRRLTAPGLSPDELAGLLRRIGRR